MQQVEIQEIGRLIKVRGLISGLHAELKLQRPTLSRDTIYRAFNEPQCYTELLNEIRHTAKRMLNDTAVQEAA